MRSHNKRWSDSEEELLKTLISRGAKVANVSFCLGRTARSIRRRVELLKLSWKTARRQAKSSLRTNRIKRSPRLPWTDEEEILLCELLCAGNDEQATSAKMGRTIYAVRNRASRLRLSLKVSSKEKGTEAEKGLGSQAHYPLR